MKHDVVNAACLLLMTTHAPICLSFQMARPAAVSNYHQPKLAVSHGQRISNSTLLFFMQVSGSNVVPMSVQTQNLVSDTLLTLLSSDHVFLIKLTEVDETQPVNGVGSATMTYIMQKASATTDVTTVRAALSVVQTAT